MGSIVMNGARIGRASQKIRSAAASSHHSDALDRRSTTAGPTAAGGWSGP